ncbi:hypothetical protein SKAU_G00032150 [Synaphobranchus kaupii]|uniref:Uncharacterized protein n=1 Tax=Synaphobranchus kaupii TaxID=118154 RepID=A0A9Q1JG16_SYNKA|nr:hypothetical protein SKAU_G00032150 [Synaphobranchus kaupii]
MQEKESATFNTSMLLQPSPFVQRKASSHECSASTGVASAVVQKRCGPNFIHLCKTMEHLKFTGIPGKWEMLKQKTASVEDFVNELTKKLEFFPKHLFNAKWQSKQFDQVHNNVPKRWTVLCSDFGENFNCHFQDEAQAAHWNYNQATIHPIVAYYRCLEENCNEITCESLVLISDDCKHDHHAVQHMMTLANKHLADKGVCSDVQVSFSDGSPTQYKNKVAFCDASHGKCKVQKHIFGSRHGKGPCDGEISVVKRCAANAVRGRRRIISNAEDLFSFGQDNLSLPKDDVEHVHSRRKFFFVKEGEIERNREHRMP